MALEPEFYARHAKNRASELTFPGAQRHKQLIFETGSCRIYGHSFSCTKRCHGTIDGWVTKEYLNDSSVTKTERLKYSIIPQYKTMALLQKIISNADTFTPDEIDYIPVPPRTEREYIYAFILHDYLQINVPFNILFPYDHELGIGYGKVFQETDEDGNLEYVAYFPETCTEGETPGTFKVWALFYDESLDEDKQYRLSYFSFMPKYGLGQTLWRCKVTENWEIISELDDREDTYSPLCKDDDEEYSRIQLIYIRAFATYICKEEERYRDADNYLGKDW